MKNECGQEAEQGLVHKYKHVSESLYSVSSLILASGENGELWCERTWEH